MTPKKKGFSVKWKKQSGQVTGYEISYSTGSKFPAKKMKILQAGKRSQTSKAALKLKAGKKYYVRLRAYKLVQINGKQEKLYSDWSKVKTVKTKR